MFDVLKGRRYFITDEKYVTKLLTVINAYDKFLGNQNLAVGNCKWADDPEKWFVHFDASNKDYDEILKDILQQGTISVIISPNGLRNLYIKMGS